MTEAFPDRRDQLFGREADVHFLADRAARPGLTAVVAQPLMGKTWTMNEVARRLLEERRYLVGYHESKAAESSHLLYAVSNLYVRWLDDSAMREQAISLWERHKDSLVPLVAKMMGMLFDKLGASEVAGGVAGVVRSAFDGLANAQKDLLSGGLQIAPLPYDEARSLASLVANVSKRRVVLILDAWEKSPSPRAEFATLEAFLKHQDAWPHTHVFLAVRNPELDSTKVNDEAYRRTRDLCSINPAAALYELPPMRQEEARERLRIVSFVRDRVPAAKTHTEQRILEMIDGYPGVLDFWTNEANRSAMRTEEDLRKEASNAHALRYLELAHLLSGLQETQCMLAARLAVFQRLDAQSWVGFRELLLKDQAEAAVRDLTDSGVLADESFPTYGHDTRHAAARRWLVDHKRPLMRRTSEQIIETLAARITGISSASRPFLEALSACSETARQVGADPITCCLVDAARAAFGDDEAIAHRGFDELYPKAVERNRSFVPLVAASLFNRGVTKRLRGDRDGEIADYTAAIELPGAPADQVATALYNRGVARGLLGDGAGEIADYTATIELSEAPANQVARALVSRGIKKAQHSDSDGEIADYTAAIELPGAQADQVAKALYNRGVARGLLGDGAGEITDYTAAIELFEAPANQVAKALVNRGIAKAQHGYSDGAITDFTAAIELPGAPAEQVAQALVNRGLTKGQRGDSDGAIADYTAAIELPGAPADQVAKALANRCITKGHGGDSDGAVADYAALVELPGVPASVLRDVYAILTNMAVPPHAGQ